MSNPEDGQGHGDRTLAPMVAPPSTPAPTPGNLTTLDATALRKLRDLDPDGTLRVIPRVLDIYRTSLLLAIDELTPQLHGNRPAETLRIAHKLKSSSASVGALGLAGACAKVEQDVRSGTPFDMRLAVQLLLDEGNAALAAVEAMLRR